MASHELPHMSEAELEAFLADHTIELGLTPQDADCFRIRRRRRSLEMHEGSGNTAGINSSTNNSPIRLGGNNNNNNNNSSLALVPGGHDAYNISRNISAAAGGGGGGGYGSRGTGSNTAMAPLGSGPFRFVKTCLLGDDTEGKAELAAMFYTFGDAPVPNPRPDLARRPVTCTVVDVQSRTLSVATPVRDATGHTVNTTAIWRHELWMPDNDNVNRELRAETLSGTHAIIVAFSTKSRKSFDAAAAIWLPEAIRFARSSGGSKSNGCEIPIILVGTNAEARNSNTTTANNNNNNSSPPSNVQNNNNNNNFVTATEAIQLAQDSGAAKYVEVYSGNSFHVRELFVQVVQAAVGARVIAGVPDHFLWKRHRLQCRVYDEFFRAPKPEGYFHSWTGQFILTSSSSSASGGDHSAAGVEYFGTLDGSDPSSSETAFAIRGPLDLAKGKLQSLAREALGAQTHDAPPPSLKVIAKKRGFFNSLPASFPLPKTTPNPFGYVDVSSKLLHLFVRASRSFLGVAGNNNMRNNNDGGNSDILSNKNNNNNGDFLALSQMTPWESNANNNFNNNNTNNNTFFSSNKDLYDEEHEKFLQMVEIRYTLDGSEPDENSPVFVAPVQLDTGSASTSSSRRNTNYQEPMLPWSTRGSHPPQEVRAVAVASGCFRSESVKIEIPEVLPAPRCVFNPTDGSFKIDGGTSTPGVEFRYTTDGSVPCGHSNLYSRPFSIRRIGEGAVQQVRVAAFPKLALPSVAVTVNINNSGSGGGGSGTPRGGIHHNHRDASGSVVPASSNGDERTGSAISTSSGFENLPRVQAPSSNDVPVQMNRAALLLAAKSRQSHNNNNNVNNINGPTPRVAPGSRDATPTPRERFTQPKNRSGSANANNNNNKRASSPAAAAAPTSSNSQQQQQQQQQQKNTNNNVVPFDFPNPIKLFYLTATTPGEGKGPKYFRILVKDVGGENNNNNNNNASGSSFKPVAEGNLEDYAGIQTLPLPADSRMLKITSVRCEFGDVPEREGEGPPSSSKFQLLDLKVHGNPW